MFACQKDLTLSVANTSGTARENEMVEMNLEALGSGLLPGNFVVTGMDGEEVPHQITYDGKLIFRASVRPHTVVNYRIQKGTPRPPEAIATGRHYPERLDDIAWENDRIAFRTYGPALQQTGERAFGYDIWVKRVPYPVVENRYRMELDPETVALLKMLRQTDPQAAQQLADSVSYHIDHGNGLDYYSVGPTLGAGTSALLAGDSIVYPYCYATYEILDNGPLRFSMKLTYLPLTVGGDADVIETRVISLDAGSQLNRICVSYANLSRPARIATGIVLHEPSNEYVAEAQDGFIAYADPSDPANGQTFVGAVFPGELSEAKAVYFSAEEQADRKANGHLLAIGDYRPESLYTYYAGGGWSKWGFETPASWFNYVKTFAERVREPLTVTVQ
jgi:hypothetical protein